MWNISTARWAVPYKILFITALFLLSCTIIAQVGVTYFKNILHA